MYVPQRQDVSGYVVVDGCVGGGGCGASDVGGCCNCGGVGAVVVFIVVFVVAAAVVVIVLDVAVVFALSMFLVLFLFCSLSLSPWLLLASGGEALLQYGHKKARFQEPRGAVPSHPGRCDAVRRALRRQGRLVHLQEGTRIHSCRTFKLR